jgi:hypothetical protein
VVEGFQFVPQNRQLRSGDLGIKITATVSWFGPQNQAGFGLSVAPRNRRRKVGAGHASRSSGLLQVKASRASVSQFASKLAEARRWVVHVASSRGCIKVKSKTDGSIRRAASDPATLDLLFWFY